MTSASRRYRFLVIGCGSIGTRHLRNLQALNAGEIVAYDVRPDRRQDVASRFGVHTVEHLEEGWESHPDVALITVPTSAHISLALEAADRGCHLFIEKPLGDRFDGLPRLLDVVKARELVTLVGCNLRFHPGVRQMKHLVTQGVVGRVVAARLEMGQYLPDWHPWEDYRHGYSARRDLGGGIILDAIHEIDYARWLLGEVDAVSCFTGSVSGLAIETEGIAAILLRFRSGAIGEIHVDYVQRASSRTCHIIGEEGTIRWDVATGVRWYSAATKAWQVMEHPEGFEFNHMYLDEMQHFLRCLEGQDVPALDVGEAARVLEVALAAKTSAETQQVMTLGSSR